MPCSVVLSGYAHARTRKFIVYLSASWRWSITHLPLSSCMSKQHAAHTAALQGHHALLNRMHSQDALHTGQGLYTAQPGVHAGSTSDGLNGLVKSTQCPDLASVSPRSCTTIVAALDNYFDGALQTAHTRTRS